MIRKRLRDEGGDDDNNDDDDVISVPEWRVSMTRDALGFGPAGTPDAAATAMEAMEEKEFYEPVQLPSRRKETKALGKPGPRSQCFLCCYVGERDTLLPSEEVMALVEMLRNNITNMDWTALAVMVAEHYERFRERMNRHLRVGERALPPMNAATVLHHIRTHIPDPEVKQLVILAELQEVRQCILQSVLERSTLNKKRTRVNKGQIDALDKIIKMEMQTQARDPSKMIGYSAGARVEPSARRQGVAALSNKRLINYMKGNGN